MDISSLQNFQNRVKAELFTNILPFYPQHTLDHRYGGFYGYLSNHLAVQPAAPKGLIQHSRLLWTYAQAYRLFNQPEHLALAERAYRYLLDHLWDAHYGGLFWLVDAPGAPLTTTKMAYGQAFGLYAFSEYFRATGYQPALDYAIALFELIELHLAEPVHGGYLEGGNADWSPFTGLSIDSVPAAKTMNTHLHLLEAYTNLLRVWDTPRLRASLSQLLAVTLTHLIDAETGHFKLHFDAAWQSLTPHVSYGHDIEGSWLLMEAAEVLGDPALLAQAQPIALKMAEATLLEGLDFDGGLFNEGGPAGLIDTNKDWWPQAEAMVGFLNAYQLSGDPRFLAASLNSWEFIDRFIIDHTHGEWFWAVDRKGVPHNREKIGLWKVCYHNGRACMEIVQRIDHLLAA